jgi:hypothetical protein
MSLRRACHAALLLCLVLAGAPAAADPCDAPAELLLPGEKLPHAGRAVADRRALRVLVLGSASSTLGGTSAPSSAYPARLSTELVDRLPRTDIIVQTRGGRGMTARDMAALLDPALAEFQPDLVIWQTGTVDAVGGIDPDEFAATLRTGAERLAIAGIDLIVMDQQFSRTARATLNFAPYRAAMEALDTAGASQLLRRYDLMKHWAEAGQIDLERAARRDWQRTADQLHACLARILADGIVAGLRGPRP